MPNGPGVLGGVLDPVTNALQQANIRTIGVRRVVEEARDGCRPLAHFDHITDLDLNLRSTIT